MLPAWPPWTWHDPGGLGQTKPYGQPLSGIWALEKAFERGWTSLTRFMGYRDKRDFREVRTLPKPRVTLLSPTLWAAWACPDNSHCQQAGLLVLLPSRQPPSLART